MSIPDNIKRLRTTRERLNTARHNLTPPAEWVTETEQVTGYILGHTARYAPVMGALEATRWQIDALLACVAQVEAAINAAIAHHTEQATEARSSTTRPPPWVQNSHGDRYPEEVMPYEEALPRRVRAGAGMPIVGYIQLDGRDFGAITAIRTDPWAIAVARRVAELKLRRSRTLFNHVEMKAVAMMIETGARHGQVIVNHAPCLRHDVACVKWMHRYGGLIMSEV
ncbi:DddA-like double-stranded DNA deaminase toxin [Actinokineospora terrae]|uniref:SCP1.201-like deaminase n=1 Tax=Actinokineospora terrae TaxID=155974 RepID=A0A1H9XKI3_9PSEU|nr:DddA-like double-stranded DNA deaminase toxin [Actinokineospora terrae]SES46327.1 SCP1.201-like deaminase [Actinokineospora terrae]